MTQSDELLVVPFQINAGEYSVAVILQDGNIGRMHEYDPVEVPVAGLPEPFASSRLRDIIITYVTDAERPEFIRIGETEGLKAALRFVSRGFRYRPDRGDHDRGLERFTHGGNG